MIFEKPFCFADTGGEIFRQQQHLIANNYINLQELIKMRARS